MNEREALNLALDAFEYIENNYMSLPQVGMQAITAIKEVLAQPEQEPDYYGLTSDHLWISITKDHYNKLKPEFRMACYTTPPQRKPLTDDETQKLIHDKEYLDELTKQQYY